MRHVETTFDFKCRTDLNLEFNSYNLRRESNQVQIQNILDANDATNLSVMLQQRWWYHRIIIKQNIETAILIFRDPLAY